MLLCCFAVDVVFVVVVAIVVVGAVFFLLSMSFSLLLFDLLPRYFG